MRTVDEQLSGVHKATDEITITPDTIGEAIRNAVKTLPHARCGAWHGFIGANLDENNADNEIPDDVA